MDALTGKHVPHVSVVTPVYNGEEYIAECIESVMAQRYPNWRYTIVNNCSTDKTLDIAARYAEKDKRIQIVNNPTFVDVIENHNIAFRALSPESKYCKLVSADDWLYPECLERLVAVAERHPSAGMVGCYSTTNMGIRQCDIPLRQEMFPGSLVARMHLLGSRVLSAPTTVLYRADLIRNNEPFFSVSAPSADIHASFKILQHCDYGFAHQILCFEKVHEGSVSGQLMKFNSFFVDRLEFVVKYGPVYLTPDEIEGRINELLSRYYEYLADRTIHFEGSEFWAYHRKRLEAMGYPLNAVRLAGAVFSKMADLLGNPKQTAEKLLRRLKRNEALSRDERWRHW